MADDPKTEATEPAKGKTAASPAKKAVTAIAKADPEVAAANRALSKTLERGADSTAAKAAKGPAAKPATTTPVKPVKVAPKKASARKGPTTPGAAFKKFAFTGGSSNAHGLVVAEFLGCMTLIVLSPILERKPNDGHLYEANDFVRLTAVCLVFFLLALMCNSQKSSRLASAFGGLITLGIMFNSAPAVLKLGSIFSNAAANQGIVSSAPAGTDTVSTTSYTPVPLSGNPSINVAPPGSASTGGGATAGGSTGTGTVSA